MKRSWQRLRIEIEKSWRETCELNRAHPLAKTLFNPDVLPAFHDPFAGGGALPIEAQRLGLESYASDLNPVAVLINKAMIEIPARFAGTPPVGPLPNSEVQSNISMGWPGSKGLAEDVRRYGAYLRDEAFKRVGHLYPKVRLPSEYGGGDANVVAWLWARTVKSPIQFSPMWMCPWCQPFILSTKAGREVFVEPIVEGNSFRFEIRRGRPTAAAKDGTKVGRGGNFQCLFSSTSIPVDYIREQGEQKKLVLD